MYPQLFLDNPDASIPDLVAFWAVFYAWIGSEIYYGYRLRPRREATRHDSRSTWILVGLIWLGVVVGFGLAFAAPSLAFTSGRRPLLYLGIVLILAGMALRWYSIRVLGQSFTVTIATRPDEQVVEAGPYRWIRHPSYTGSLLTVIGALVAVTNPLSFLGLLLPIAGHAYRIRVEEQVLVENLGEPYRSYMKRTKRLVPFVV